MLGTLLLPPAPDDDDPPAIGDPTLACARATAACADSYNCRFSSSADIHLLCLLELLTGVDVGAGLLIEAVSAWPFCDADDCETRQA